MRQRVPWLRPLAISLLIVLLGVIGYLLVSYFGGWVFDRLPAGLIWMASLVFPFIFIGPPIILILLWANWLRREQRSRWWSYLMGMLWTIVWIVVLPGLVAVITGEGQPYDVRLFYDPSSLVALGMMLVLVVLTVVFDNWIHAPKKPLTTPPG